MDEIEQVHEIDEANYELSKRLLGDSFSIVQNLLDLYSELGRLIEGTLVKPPNELVIAVQFVLACRYQLTLGALTAFRGHLTDSSAYTRKAIELCGFAWGVKQDPDLASLWINAGDTEAAYSAYENKFRTGKLFPKGHHVLRELRNRYDVCSKLSHPSIYSLSRHIQADPSAATIRLNYSELKPQDPSEPIRTLLVIVDTHFGILRIFEEIFSDLIAHDRSTWEIRRNAVDAQIGLHRSKWRSVIA